MEWMEVEFTFRHRWSAVAVVLRILFGDVSWGDRDGRIS